MVSKCHKRKGYKGMESEIMIKELPKGDCEGVNCGLEDDWIPEAQHGEIDDEIDNIIHMRHVI